MPPAPPSLPRIACFISGGGRTVLNLLDCIEQGELPAHIALVVASDNTLGVARCQARGLHVVIEPGTMRPDRLAQLLALHRIDLVVLAGYLKLLPIPPGFERRVLNIHPALLPRFAGKGMHGEHVHRAVIDSGDRESGCTVHYCDAHYDTGAIILQLKCPVLASDTPQSLAARVFELECQAYPRAIRSVIESWSNPGTLPTSKSS